MGKRLRTQRRGKGGSVFRAKGKGIKSEYASYQDFEGKTVISSEIVDLVKESGRNSILAKLLLENGAQDYVIAAEGVSVGQQVLIGDGDDVSVGNILTLSNIPEGCPVFNIELEPGDGGKLVRAPGSYALVVIKDAKNANIKMPSGKIKKIPLKGRATIGCAAGGERAEKPFMKAGNKFYAMKAKSRKYVTVRGVAQNPVSHPFGGEQHHAGKSKSVGRHASPGRKVGHIASKRTGRKKK